MGSHARLEVGSVLALAAGVYNLVMLGWPFGGCTPLPVSAGGGPLSP